MLELVCLKIELKILGIIDEVPFLLSRNISDTFSCLIKFSESEIEMYLVQSKKGKVLEFIKLIIILNNKVFKNIEL